MSSQQRARIWSQRVQESCGGEAGRHLSSQMAVTAMVGSYTLMRGRGFRVTPLSAKSIGGLGGIVLGGVLGWGLGSSIACKSMGDSAQYYYLMGNRGSIVGGNAPFDARSAQ